MKVGDMVITPHGPGTIKAIDLPNSRAISYGVLHDTFPEKMSRVFKDDILYYQKRELQVVRKEETKDD